MSDVRATLAEILHDNGCHRDDAEELADAILAAPGVTTIALPEPDGPPDDDGQVYFGDYDIRVDNTGRSAPGDIWTDFGLGRDVLRCLNPATARSWGLFLLAAADAAEAANNG